jgi:hypothetical protein
MPNGWQLGVGDENGSDECGMMNDGERRGTAGNGSDE